MVLEAIMIGVGVIGAALIGWGAGEMRYRRERKLRLELEQAHRAAEPQTPVEYLRRAIMDLGEVSHTFDHSAGLYQLELKLTPRIIARIKNEFEAADRIMLPCHVPGCIQVDGMLISAAERKGAK